MKVTILKKMIKEGVSARTGNEYKIKSLFVKFEDENLYKKMIIHLKSKGADSDMIDKFISAKEYKGVMNYTFSLNCSNYTFDKVSQFGVLDVVLEFNINDAGYINAKIKVIDRKEQIHSYDESGSEDIVEGWAMGEPEKVEKSELEVEATNENEVPIPIIEDGNSDLPF